jgi:hypothetical protein
MPRKTVKEQKQKRPTDTDTNRNRIRAVTDNLVGNEDPDDIMMELMETLKDSEISPQEVQSGKYYIFVYNPKTPFVQYDQNPLVAVTDVFQWGFRGINFHWSTRTSQPIRQYTLTEVAGGVYEVYASELKDLRALPFANFRLNS